MVGAIIELVTNRNAPQSYWMTEDPQITFFKCVLRRHTNYSSENITVPFGGPVMFGSKIQAVLPRKGDLIHRIVFQAEIDPIDVQYPNTRTQDLAKLIENSSVSSELLEYFEPGQCLADLFPALDELINHHRLVLEESEEKKPRLSNFQVRDETRFLEELANHLATGRNKSTIHLINLLRTRWNSDNLPTIYRPPKPLEPEYYGELTHLLRQTTPLVFFQKFKSRQAFNFQSTIPVSLEPSGSLMIDTNFWNHLLSRAPSHHQELELMMTSTAFEIQILFEKYDRLFSSTTNLFFAGSLPASGMYSYLFDNQKPVLNLTLWFFYWIKMLTSLQTSQPEKQELLRFIEAEIDFQMHDAAYIVNDIFTHSVGGMGQYYPAPIDNTEMVVSISFYRSQWPSIEEIFELIELLAGETEIGKGFIEIKNYFEKMDEGVDHYEFETELGQIFQATWGKNFDQMAFYYSLEKINQRAQNQLYSRLPAPAPENLYHLRPRRGQKAYLQTPYLNRFGTLVDPVPSPFDPETIEISTEYYSRHFFQPIHHPILLPRTTNIRQKNGKITNNNYHRVRVDSIIIEKKQNTLDIEFYPDDTLAKALNRITRKNYGDEVIDPKNNPETAKELYWDYLQSSLEMKKIYQNLVWWLSVEKKPFLAIADVIDHINYLVNLIVEILPVLTSKRMMLERWQPWFQKIAIEESDLRQMKEKLERDGLGCLNDSKLPFWMYHCLIDVLESPPAKIQDCLQAQTIDELLIKLIYSLSGINDQIIEKSLSAQQQYLRELGDKLDEQCLNEKMKISELEDLRYKIAQIMVRSGAPSAWIEKLGHYLVKNVRYQMSDNGDNPIRSELSYGSDWMEVRSQLTLDPGKRDGYNRMIGHLPELYHYREGSKPSISINLPLIFHFNNNIAQSLPIIASSHSQHLIEIELRKLSDLFYYDENARIVKLPSIRARLMVDYLFLEAPERKRFTTGMTEYLIEQIHSDYHSLQPIIEQTIEHNFTHPARGLIILIRPDVHLNGKIPDYFFGEKQWNNYSLYPRYSHRRLKNHIIHSYSNLLKRLQITDRKFGLIRLIDNLVSNSDSAIAWHNLKEKLMNDKIARPKTMKMRDAWEEILDGNMEMMNELSYALMEAIDLNVNPTLDYQALLVENPVVNPARKIIHIVEEMPIIPEINSTYLDTIQPYFHSLVTPSVGINTYFWSLHPFGIQPTGTLNMSCVENINSKITLEEILEGSIITLLIGVSMLRCFSGFTAIGW
jgi:hypothetical protein